MEDRHFPFLLSRLLKILEQVINTGALLLSDGVPLDCSSEERHLQKGWLSFPEP